MCNAEKHKPRSTQVTQTLSAHNSSSRKQWWWWRRRRQHSLAARQLALKNCNDAGAAGAAAELGRGLCCIERSRSLPSLFFALANEEKCKCNGTFSHAYHIDTNTYSWSWALSAALRCSRRNVYARACHGEKRLLPSLASLASLANGERQKTVATRETLVAYAKKDTHTLRCIMLARLKARRVGRRNATHLTSHTHKRRHILYFVHV